VDVSFRIELLSPVVRSPGLVNVLPDPEGFVNDIARTDLEFVVGVHASEEDLDIILLVDFRVTFGQRTHTSVSSAVKPK
jgi:hypothetical protein